MTTLAASRRSTHQVQKLTAFWREFSKERIALLSICLLIFIATLSIILPLLPLADPMEFAFDQYMAPCSQHWMGTDNYGRSVASRVLWGTRLALVVGLGASGISTFLGIVLGAISGYYGGWVDNLLSRIFDIFLLIPAFFLAMLMVALFGSNIYLIVLVIGFTGWPRSARIMRAQVLTLKKRVFIDVTRASGASHPQALFQHVIPNGLAPVITHGTIIMGSAILMEAGLSFLGLGDPNTVSWGRMIFEGQSHLRLAPWMTIFPGLALMLVVCALNLTGDGLSRAVNPHHQARQGMSRLDIPEQFLPQVEVRDTSVSEGRNPSSQSPQDTGARTCWNPQGVCDTAIQNDEADCVVLDVQSLTLYYALENAWLHAVDDVSFHLRRGESLGLVGESGCGKTSVGLTLMRILPPNGRVMRGGAFLNGTEILSMEEDEFREVRWSRLSMVFQSSMNALNPVKSAGTQLVNAYLLHRPDATHEEALGRVRELFDIVGISQGRLRSYPHELSGGMRQRVMIAMALLLQPEVIIADEPTTALDVLVQDQILAELLRLKEQMHLSMILISHDVGIVAETCEQIAVMYAGQIVERAPARALFHDSHHPYTRGLLDSLPTLYGERRELLALPGESTPAIGQTVGCRFAPRCPLAKEVCRTTMPSLLLIGSGHWSRCHFALEGKVKTVWR